ncbi:MAG: hypothetical protein KME21_29025 [Desmonostoc vinosum HA7617-LM4]|jgi:hypothetical protein|nr:hypothetical protein [Desmonostoc vinosum HA7617-LM4]
MNKLSILQISIAEEDKRTLTLARAIALSEGQFSLYLLRCNSVASRQRIVQHLHQICPVTIRSLTLPPSVTRLYTNISSQLGDEQPRALMVFGLEFVENIDAVLISTNHVREELRKKFQFPMLLWVNDTILVKLIRIAPELENWSTVIEI